MLTNTLPSIHCTSNSIIISWRPQSAQQCEDAFLHPGITDLPASQASPAKYSGYVVLVSFAGLAIFVVEWLRKLVANFMFNRAVLWSY
jgi:hypothetical protein